MFILFGVLILFFYFNPHYILKDLQRPENLKLTKDLFLVFLISLPVLVAHRGMQLIFNIRLHDYLYQRVFSIFNLLKIFSVLYFFKDGEYNIVGYYIFTQVITIVSVVFGAFVARKHFKYSFLSLIKAIRYNPEVYKKTKSLAYNSLFITISWVLYYELDSLVIGKFVGLREVAVFNICISVMTLSRSLYGILYNPFSAKFNHFLGVGNRNKLTEAFKKILIIGLPLSIIPTTILILAMKNFIYSWVGTEYADAIPIITVMFASYYFAFLSNPAGIAMVAIQSIRGLYLISAVLPIIYWVGIILSFNYFGLFAFGIFKLVAFSISGLLYFYFAKDLFDIQWIIFFRKNVVPAIITIAILSILHIFVKDLLPVVKGKVEFIKFSLIAMSYGLIGMMVYYVMASEFRLTMKELFLSSFNRKTK
ncbi:lipopolysaccharide biosynthesis protein [Pedobacter sp. V48]|uniref:lipopolysaccharide biosynthesis protein n=1 Tax=Pedobacter sp. V48 TaxID=509635 RepID=UPI0004AD820A|nr:hypothetical protein [Pedobacter sp. V48]